MLSNKLILTNTLKTLTIALFTLGSVTAFANGHGDHSKDDLKEMSETATDAHESATSKLSNLNTDTEKAMSDDVVSDLEGKVEGEMNESKSDAMQELKDKASSLAEE